MTDYLDNLVQHSLPGLPEALNVLQPRLPTRFEASGVEGVGLARSANVDSIETLDGPGLDPGRWETSQSTPALAEERWPGQPAPRAIGTQQGILESPWPGSVPSSDHEGRPVTQPNIRMDRDPKISNDLDSSPPAGMVSETKAATPISVKDQTQTMNKGQDSLALGKLANAETVAWQSPGLPLQSSNIGRYQRQIEPKLQPPVRGFQKEARTGPTVAITIGRIEVRAITPPAPTRPVRRAALQSKPNTLSLDDYLRGRTPGNRGTAGGSGES
ncbi:MAG: hypothetical protein U9R25_06650 [Chloroflexota bacterium]|nr:hypothetical protein [Chloroflexota bacterium]